LHIFAQFKLSPSIDQIDQSIAGCEHTLSR
jgi:hypothetical protein